jgi:hypothetical protein
MSMTVAEIEEEHATAASWGAIVAGAVAACAVTLLLLVFGVGIGFTMISPWGGEGASTTTMAIASGIYLIVVALIASTIGGYLTGRLRRRWIATHQDEAYFRDSAHGFVSWALATLISATVLGSAIAHVMSGAAAFAPAPNNATTLAFANPIDDYVDTLLRPQPTPTAPAMSNAPATTPAPLTSFNENRNVTTTRAEFSRLLAATMRRNGVLTNGERIYLAQTVATRTGLSQADADKRVSEVIDQAKIAADQARNTITTLALWLAAAMLAGALAASLAATEGGMLRDSKWYEPGWRWGARG